MKYRLYVTSAAYRQLKKLDGSVQAAIQDKLGNLCENSYSDAFDVKKLQEREGYRLCAGDYRVIYRLHNNELIVEVIAIGHRREIY